MKKLISFILVLAMLASFTLVFGGCGTPAQGTEAAKLLLARERMDENTIGAKIDLFSTPDSANVLRAEAPTELYSSLTQLNATAEQKADFTWAANLFNKHSHSMVEFTQFMGAVESTAAGAAKAIGKMKKDVGITDMWVDFGIFEEYDYMLSVHESEDILYVRGDNLFNVYKRYTNQDAKNVYELYGYITYNDGTHGEIRELFIPGERYEYMFIPSAENAACDYFIAENSRGYWMATRFSTVEDRAQFSPLIIKDGLGYGAHVEATRDGGLDAIWYDVFDPQSGRELLRINIGATYTTVSLYIPGIQSGFVSVGAVDEHIYEYDEGLLAAHYISEMTTVKGTFPTGTGSTSGVTFDSGYVQYLGYAGGYAATYYGNLEFGYGYEEMPDLADMFSRFFSCFAEFGLTTYCDADKVLASISHASAMGEAFGSVFTWNGYYTDSIESIFLAEEVLLRDFAEHRAMYEAVKNNPYASGSRYLATNEFSRMDALVGGSATYRDGVITLDALGATLTDATYLEIGGKYVLRIGLTLTDENGNPVSVNTVPLSNGAQTGVTYDGTTLSVSLSGNFDLPKNLDSGKYAIVAYIATAEEGIRVTEMEKIAFLDIATGELASAAMDITVEKSGDFMFVVYAIKNTMRLTQTAEKDTYTHKEVSRLLNIAFLEKGYPQSGAVLEYENGTAVAEDATLEKGTYRMKGYLATEDGLAESYIYLTLS